MAAARRAARRAAAPWAGSAGAAAARARQSWKNFQKICRLTPMNLKRWSLTHAQAIAAYRYDPDTGIVIGPRGLRVGHISHKNGDGSRIKVVAQRKGEGRIPIARLIWFLVTGAWPDRIVDHANGDPLDQRWENLRLATTVENNFNSAQRIGASGYRNVVRGAHGKGWRVRFDRKVKGQRKTTRFVSGAFATPEEAAILAERKRAELFGVYGSNRRRS